jgi:uncharacterized protein YkwD
MTRKYDLDEARPRRRARTARSGLALAVAAVLAVALTGCLSNDQTQDVTLINQARKDNRAAAVTADTAAMTKAQAWSEHMARTGVLEHTGGGTSVNPRPLTGWCKYGENVGYGPSIAAVHQAFLNSPPHKANMIGPYNRVGTGAYWSKGYVWVTEIYLQAC